MKILLDECVPAGLARHLAGHNCTTVPVAGLAGSRNGELLSMAEQRGFEVFVTIDQGVAYQQNLSGRKIAILILRPKSSRLADLLQLLPQSLEAVERMKPGALQVIGI